MTATKTPGQIAYEAYIHGDDIPWELYTRPPQTPWRELHPAHKRAWDAAAQAVLAPRLTDQAAQLHHLIDFVVEHAPQAYLDKVHIWLTDLSGIVHQQHHAQPLEDTP